jgi:hypothetical protein
VKFTSFLTNLKIDVGLSYYIRVLQQVSSHIRVQWSSPASSPTFRLTWGGWATTSGSSIRLTQCTSSCGNGSPLLFVRDSKRPKKSTRGEGLLLYFFRV